MQQYAGYKGSLDVGSQTLNIETRAVGAHSAGASAFLEYGFAVFGPDAVSVPLVMYTPTPTLSVFASVGSAVDNRAFASLSLLTDGGVNVFEQAQGSATGTVNSTFQPAIHFSMTANTDRALVDMRLVASSAGVNAAPGQVQFEVVSSGELDPYVVIDPSFAKATQYHLVFSAGVGNVAPVPVPSMLGCMAAGVVGLLRRRLV